MIKGRSLLRMGIIVTWMVTNGTIIIPFGYTINIEPGQSSSLCGKERMIMKMMGFMILVVIFALLAGEYRKQTAMVSISENCIR